MAERLALLDLLVDREVVLAEVRGLLLVERSHAELLMCERLLLAARRSVAVVCVVAEVRLVFFVAVSVHRVHAAEVTFVF